MWPRFFKLLHYLVLSLYIVTAATIVAVLRAAEWHQSLLRFSSRVWLAFLAYVGSTGPGFVSPIILSILSIALTLVCIGFFQGRAAMLKHWWETAFISAVVLVTTMLLVYGPQFIWQIVRVAQKEHQSLVSVNTQLVADNRSLHGQLTEAQTNAEQRCEQAKDTEINRLKKQLNAACYHPDRRLTGEEREHLFLELKTLAQNLRKSKQEPMIRIYSFNRDKESANFAGELRKIFEDAGWTLKWAISEQEQKNASDQEKWVYEQGGITGVVVFNKDFPGGYVGISLRGMLAELNLGNDLWTFQQMKSMPHLDDTILWVGYKPTYP
jgi:hypothetical protein